MSVSTQNHHILPTAIYNRFATDIAAWTGSDYNNNAGYNRIELPTDISGANGQSSTVGHSGSHPGVSDAWAAVLSDIKNKVADGM